MLRRSSVQIGVLILLTAVAYAPAFHGAFLFDDQAALLENTSIREWSTAFSPPKETTVAGRPLSNLTFAVNYALTGLAPAPMHLTNVAIHLVAAIVLLLLLRSTLQLPQLRGRFDDRLPLVIALLWALHPMQTESVTYVIQRVESLGGMFILLTLYCSLQAQVKSSRGWAIGAVASALAGVLSKEIAAVVPLLVVLFDRAFLFESLRSVWQARWKHYAALTAIWIPTAAIQATGPRRISAGLHFSGFGPWSYLKIQAGAILRYIRLALLPTDLVFDYGEVGDAVPVPQSFTEWGPRGLAVLALVALALWAWRRAPALGFLGTAFFILLAPSSSFVPIATEVMAEHRMYLPLAVIAVLVAVGVSQVFRGQSKSISTGPTLLAISVVASLGFSTYLRNQVYQSPVALWQDVVSKWPTNVRGWTALGESYRAAGDLETAREAFTEAARRDPLHLNANRALASDAEARGDVNGAIAIYQRLVPRWSKNVDVRFNLANNLTKQRRWKEAAEQLAVLVELKPNDADAHSLYGDVLTQLGDHEHAKLELERALTLKPDDARTQFRYGNLLARTDPERAIVALRRAVELDPLLTIGKHRLALLESDAGHYSEAVRLLREVAAQEPSRTMALQDLAWILATAPDDAARKGADAVELSVRASGPTPNAQALETLAAAQAESGQFEAAVATQKLALERAKDPNSEMQARLALYKQKQPYRLAKKTKTP